MIWFFKAGRGTTGQDTLPYGTIALLPTFSRGLRVEAGYSGRIGIERDEDNGKV